VDPHRRALTTAPSFYPSKRDLWLEIVIWMVSLFSFSVGLSPFLIPTDRRISTLVMTLCFAVGAFALWSFYTTGYTLLSDQLVIRSGPFRFRVPFAEITSVCPTRNPISSPACSLDRLEIRYRGGRSRILISPEDKPGLLAALVARCDRLVPSGDRLVLHGGP